MKSTFFAILAVASAVAARKINPMKEYLRVPKVEHPNRYDVSQVCIDFVSNVDDWYYLLAPPWGTTSGENPTQLCVPTNNTAGGGMFIGPEPGPNANSTKLECFFPASGTAPANCDVSLVNGYSYSVTCSTSSITVGGDINLWTDGTPCGTVSGVNCANPIGPYAANSGQISGFFQPGVQNGNTYCIWDGCPSKEEIDPTFPVSEQLTCTISGQAGPSPAAAPAV